MRIAFAISFQGNYSICNLIHLHKFKIALKTSPKYLGGSDFNNVSDSITTQIGRDGCPQCDYQSVRALMRYDTNERWFTCQNMGCDVRYYKASATGEYEIMQRRSIKAVPAELEATYQLLVDPGDLELFPVPLWNNHNWSAATKRELIEAVRKELEAPKSAAEETVNIVLQAIIDKAISDSLLHNGARTEGFGWCWKKSRP